MEKRLRLYKIPEADNIVNLLAITSDYAPDVFNEGDIYIDESDDSIFEAKIVEGELVWVRIQTQPGKFYIYKGEEEVLCYDSDFYLIDFSFPENSRIAEITSFTYSATRMGNAPTISGTLMYRDCLDELWTDRVCVLFNKMFFFIDKIPTSEFLGGAVGINANVDDRYKHSCEFVSERKLLENVYFTNVVDIEQYGDDITKLPAQWLEFSFSGDIDDFIYRLNQSLAYSGLGVQGVGFRVVKDAIESVEDKLITISDTTLKAALDLIYETWQIPYWFDGYTIHIGYSNEQQMQQAGVIMPTFRYGATQSLLSLQKSQSNDIVNRITGFGSEENIPYFYPNKNPNAIELKYLRSGSLLENYARIANPYKTVKLEASTAVTQGVPNKSYFKFMPITKTYTYDQFITINPHHKIEIANADDPVSGGVLVLDVGEPNYNIMMKYFTQAILSVQAYETGVADEAYAVKYAWVWLKEGTFQSLTFVDDWKGLFANYIRGYVKVKSYNITHDQFEHNAKYTTSFSPNSTADIIDLYYTPDHVPYTDVTWSDGETSESYEARMPLEINSIPQGTTCLLFMFVRKYKTYIYDDELTIILKDTTRFVATHTFLDVNPDWSLNGDGKVAHLYQYGIRINSGVTPIENDIIYFTREAGALPYFGQLLPYSFRDTHDIWLNAINSHYPKDGSQTDYYTFENLYKISCAKEHIENFDDIKPSIKGMTNNETPAKRIDKILDVAFDQDDNNDLLENGTDYQHPYFFVKLAKTSLDDGFGFNLFDCAIDGDTMKLNMSDGHNGGCVFEIMVKYLSDGMAYNPVGLFTEATTINGVTYPAGTPRRDLQTGEVLVNRREDAQQDTSASEVWIALKKDNQTFGSYSNGAEVVYPDSKRGNNFIPHTGDSFTITNICLPYAYIVAAEKRLYHALLDYMEKNNLRSWTFSIKFSSIYYKKHYEFMDKWLNESSEVPFFYNNIKRKYYVLSYNYKMSDNLSLPQVTIEVAEKVKPRKAIYPVPISIRPIVEYKQQFAAIATRSISRGDISSTPADSIVNNIQVYGDIMMSDGTSLSAQIKAINSEIYKNATARTRESEWDKVGQRTEIQNLFIDGTFAYNYNKYHLSRNTEVTQNSYGIVGDSSLHISLPSNGYICFLQRIDIIKDVTYTLLFYAKSDRDHTITISIDFYDNKSVLSYTETMNYVLTSEWQQYILLFSTEYDNIKEIRVSTSSKSEVEFDLDGLMIFSDNFASYDISGGIMVGSLAPRQYKISDNEIRTINKRNLSLAENGSICYCTADMAENSNINMILTKGNSDFVIRNGVLFFVLFNSNLPENGTFTIENTSLHQVPVTYCGNAVVEKLINSGDRAVFYYHDSTNIELLFVTRWGLSL